MKTIDMKQTPAVTDLFTGDAAAQILTLSAAQAFYRSSQYAAAEAENATTNGLWATAVWGTKSWGTGDPEFSEALEAWASLRYGMRLTVAGRSWTTIN